MNITEFNTLLDKLSKLNIYVIDDSISKKDYEKLDLSVDNEALNAIDISSSDELEGFIENHIQTNNAIVAFGGYLETRGIYARSDYFNEQTDPHDERNIHLGLDIWAEEGTNVLATLDGEIHSFNYNTNHGDYGPTIILKHEIDGFVFHTLYGHLSLESLDELEIGATVKKGEVISQLGSAEVNGDYAPHLHFQIIIDVEANFGDYPGVCSANNLDFYKQNCPDPNLLLGL